MRKSDAYLFVKFGQEKHDRIRKGPFGFLSQMLVYCELVTGDKHITVVSLSVFGYSLEE